MFTINYFPKYYFLYKRSKLEYILFNIKHVLLRYSAISPSIVNIYATGCVLMWSYPIKLVQYLFSCFKLHLSTQTSFYFNNTNKNIYDVKSIRFGMRNMLGVNTRDLYYLQTTCLQMTLLYRTVKKGWKL